MLHIRRSSIQAEDRDAGTAGRLEPLLAAAARPRRRERVSHLLELRVPGLRTFNVCVPAEARIDAVRTLLLSRVDGGGTLNRENFCMQKSFSGSQDLKVEI